MSDLEYRIHALPSPDPHSRRWDTEYLARLLASEGALGFELNSIVPVTGVGLFAIFTPPGGTDIFVELRDLLTKIEQAGRAIAIQFSGEIVVEGTPEDIVPGGSGSVPRPIDIYVPKDEDTGIRIAFGEDAGPAGRLVEPGQSFQTDTRQRVSAIRAGASNVRVEVVWGVPSA